MLVRLIRTVSAPDRYGPTNGMFALQRALRDRGPDWLLIGGDPRPGEMPWFWHWDDAMQAARWPGPFVHGPNILFGDSSRPGATRAERRLLECGRCRMIFTESDWYAELIRSRLRMNPPTPIAVWPYPIDPMPPGPLPAGLDLLIYVKRPADERLTALAIDLGEKFPRSHVVEYGHYRRDHLIDVARRSSACVYLSEDDRGPLALAEILCTGCPAVGIERGAPWTMDPRMGCRIDRLELPAIVAAVEHVAQLDREAVRQAAVAKFDPGAVAEKVVQELSAVSGQLSAVRG
jgi:hypothetical protein